MGQVSRRRLLAGTAAACALPIWAQSPLRWPSNPFCLGVASGYPMPDGCSLWTRLCPKPLQPDGGMPTTPVPVVCEIALDSHFARTVQRLELSARPEHAHSLHAWPSGLQPSTTYFYRFVAGDGVSAVGKTQTAPALQAQPRQLRLALASCQHYEAGLFGAWKQVAQAELNLVLFVGDYIYEGHYSRATRMREHEGDAPQNLADYRIRHALYKSDINLQAAHAAHPWLLMWYDHEVENDYAALASARLIDPALFAAQRQAAYRAYVEHLPMPRHLQSLLGQPNWGGWDASSLHLHTSLHWGQLAQLWMLDTRQHRHVQACQAPPGSSGKGGNRLVNPKSCPELLDPSRSLMGQPQERWLAQGLASNTANWRLLAQPSQIASSAPLRLGSQTQFQSDGWDGYPAARERLMQAASVGPRNVVTLGGDVHRHVAANLRLAPNDESSPVLAAEIVGSSITSRGAPDLATSAMKAANPDLLHIRGDQRGFVLLDCNLQQLQAEFWATQHPVGLFSRFSVQTRAQVVNGQAGLTVST